ncbi:SLC13 family permease [Wenzhouxiangella marina]|uniref:Anion transporter n=1 Tax=Wenzhouxiangella marina TaxID=1579979 RepID=A0A0K0XUC1_9GAMM|nr:SLC13 family permease [Wenzhouxiangella marina]AKS41283.1 Anion transporter [Wenzhouxiangella marina]MBB6086967.1 sodium-dependent dicarboxylate transporter 2/3/5 [Wenzhouxiangella marina]
MNDCPQDKTTPSRRQRIGLWLGPALFILMQWLPAPAGLEPAAWQVAALGLWMATWWISEAVPVPATALLPLVVFPLTGVSGIRDTAAPYANPLIFLFMGGFVIALGMQRWSLHKRIALGIIDRVGTHPRGIILGFMVASAFLSLWVSNTATALMMLPIGLSLISLTGPDTSEYTETQRNFTIALLLGIAYGCNIGGLGTLIGTPPNALLAAYLLETHGIQIGFGQWMLLGLPLVMIGLPLAYLILTRWVYPVDPHELPGGQALIDREQRALGPVSPEEKRIALVFMLTAALWITRPWLSDWLPGLSDAGIAVAAATALFVIPAPGKGRALLTWPELRDLPWGILLLFGGGLSLASAIGSSGLDEAIGRAVLAFESWPTVLLLALSVTVILLLTEISSNTATAAAFLPVLGAAAIGLGADPMLFAIPAALAASCAFMLPVATPPNAIVYGSGHLDVPTMARAGLWLNALFVVLIVGAAYTLMVWVFGLNTY